MYEIFEDESLAVLYPFMRKIEEDRKTEEVFKIPTTAFKPPF